MEAVFEAIRNEETEKYDSFCNMTNDLSKDWMQMIFQYYQADRKEKKQDYTPKSLAQLMAKLSGDTEVVQDLCAGSGALTIQKWCMHPYEIAEVIAEYLVDNKDLTIAMIKDNDKETLQDEIYAELTEE